MDDENSLSARLRRYGQVSSAVGGLAAHLASRSIKQKFSGEESNPASNDLTRNDFARHAHHLTSVLGALKGPLMKVAQFLATVPGALPPEYAEMFMSLQMDAPSMGQAFVRRRMASELGAGWQTRFGEFCEAAVAAASLGQVHKAKSHQGEMLAVKLQYPDMASVIQADLSQLKLILALYESWSHALDTREVQAEIALRLEEELDYRNEARNISLYQNIFSPTAARTDESLSGIYIPEVFPELSTQRVLTLSWMEGQSLLTKIQEPQQERDALGRQLFNAWYYPFYHYGVIHGDPHPGNYTVRADGGLNLLDFGCVRIFPASFIQGVIDLYRALKHEDRALAVHAYESWGFKNLTREMADIITQWAKLLYAPLLHDRVRPIQDASDGSAGWETAVKVHKELERLGGIRPPKEFVFMDRAAVGIGSVIMRLKAEQNWHALFEELIEGFDVLKVEARQKQALRNDL